MSPNPMAMGTGTVHSQGRAGSGLCSLSKGLGQGSDDELNRKASGTEQRTLTPSRVPLAASLGFALHAIGALHGDAKTHPKSWTRSRMAICHVGPLLGTEGGTSSRPRCGYRQLGRVRICPASFLAPGPLAFAPGSLRPCTPETSLGGGRRGLGPGLGGAVCACLAPLTHSWVPAGHLGRTPLEERGWCPEDDAMTRCPWLWC